MKRYRMRLEGKNYLHKYLKGELKEYTMWDEELAYTLSRCEDHSNKQGIFKLPDELDGRFSFLIKGLVECGAIEFIEDKVMDQYDKIITPYYHEVVKKKRQERYAELNGKFLSGMGPPPPLFNYPRFDDDEEDDGQFEES